MEHAEDVYTPKEAAKYLKVSVPTLGRWKREGLIQFVRIGNVTRYTRTWLNDFLQQRSMR